MEMSVIYQSHSIYSERHNAAAEKNLDQFFSPIIQTKTPTLFCNNSKNLSILSKSISSPRVQRFSPLPLCHTISPHHLSFIFVPWHQLVFIPCPPSEQCPRSRPFLLIARWPCKKAKAFFSGFNYSCVMRGSSFSPLQAKKKVLLQ